MKYFKYILLSSIAGLGLSSCELLQPDEIINPNVSEDTFLNSANAMQAWVNGTNRSFADAMGTYCELIEIMSDNYFNNYSQSSKVFDFPTILYTDADVTNMQRYIGNLRESADYGIEKVAAADAKTTKEELFNLYYIKAYSFILAGEYFRALPMEDKGEVIEWKKQLEEAIDVLDQSLDYTDNDDDKAFINTLKARAYYRLGDKENATICAQNSLNLSPTYYRQVQFDGVNSVTNSIQQAVWGTWFQPLPRLDFLDPKYFKISATEERPINIAKAEENYLILAEALLADNKLSEAKNILKELLVLVQGRPVQTGLDDSLEGRYNGGYKHYPNSSEYKVAASSEDEFRAGLVLDRQNLIDVPYISGTSVTADMIEGAGSIDECLELVYLMRQEIFFAEGRRVADLGIRLPVCEVEMANTESARNYKDAIIPDFIPLEQGMDAFTMDESAKTVVIKYNMNRIIVENKSSEYVVPFFN